MSLSQAASARWHHLRRHRVPLPDASYSSDSCSADMGHTGASTCESAHKPVVPERQRSSACCYTGPDTRAADTCTGGKGGWRRTTTRKPKRVLSWRAACDENLSTNRSEDTVRAGRPWAPYLQQQHHRCITTGSELEHEWKRTMPHEYTDKPTGPNLPSRNTNLPTLPTSHNRVIPLPLAPSCGLR